MCLAAHLSLSFLWVSSSGDGFRPDSIHVNHTLLKDGSCWWFRKYAPGDRVVEGLKKDAREAMKGLWVDTQTCRRGSGGSGASELAVAS